MTRTARNNTAPKTQANPPVAKIRVGLVTANIWERPLENGAFYSVTFERRYRHNDGNWHTAHSFAAHDVLAVAKAADLAHTRILELQAES